ncbi:O-antigen translocase [Bacteroidota bacterium]
MSKDLSSYRQIVKNTSILGGVQVIHIIVKIIQSKIIAVLLGPAGMGIISLLNSNLQFIGQLTNFGLNTSAVKNVSEANGTGNSNRVAVIVSVLRRWVWITGLLGTLFGIILSPWLSEFAFGNREYTMAFIWISISLLFNQLSSGQIVLLQGLRKIKYLANANLSGSFLGLFVSVPLYFIWGIDGIVPAIIATSLANLLRSWYFARKVNIEKVKVSRKSTFLEGKEMLTMGFMLSLSGLMTTGAGYLIYIYISNTGGVDQVGLYSAGFAIINTYFGMIFSAMGTDYFPRLSEVAANNNRARKTINQQAEVTLLIIAPILILFMVFINWAIIILFSSKFIEINEMIKWAALAMFFKASSWTMGFLLIAKGASRLFFKKELAISIITLGLNIAGYHYLKLDGLGISFLIAYVINFIILLFMVNKNYEFRFEKAFRKIFLIQFIIGISSFLIMKFSTEPLSYVLGSSLIVISSIYSLVELNKRLDLRSRFARTRNS